MKIVHVHTRTLLWFSLLSLIVVLAACNVPFSGQASSTPTATPADTITPTSLATGVASTPTTVTNGADWTMYHANATHTGYLANIPDPKKLTTAWNVHLDGAVYAEPLVVAGHVIVVTEGDSIYSLDAQTGQVRWHTNVGQPVPQSTLPCGNIDPLGITSTPVYDPATHLVFAVAEISGPSHILVGLNVDTGKVQMRRTVDLPGMDARAHQQRSALALSHGMVYIAYGGLAGDCSDYRGTIVAARTDGQGSLLSYIVPTAREAGIWAPPGPIIDAAGNLYVAVGNGASTAGAWDHSDSVLKLSPALQLLDAFAPVQWAQENATDADLGSMSPALLPGGLIYADGKGGTGYLLHADALGGIGGQANSMTVCEAFGGTAQVGSVLYVPCVGGLRQLTIGPGTQMKLGWQAPSQVIGSPVVGGHTVYCLSAGGSLYAFDATSGKVIATLPVGTVSRFATPTLYARQIFVGTFTGIVSVNIG